MRKLSCSIALLFLTVSASAITLIAGDAAGTTLLTETFSDGSFSGRGWYDAPGGSIENGAFLCTFNAGGTNCSSSAPGRHKFTDTDTIYLTYRIRFSSNWVGSGQTYHPHIFYILSNLDADYAGLAYNYMDLYSEVVDGYPEVTLQDGRNIDETRVGVDLNSVTENRAIGGCNGNSDGYGTQDCYSAGSAHYNGKHIKPAQRYFINTAGPYYKGNWHKVEMYLKLNSISGGKGIRDGVLQYWFDDVLIMNYTDMLIRTAQRPTLKFNQIVLQPYIGDGSPVQQSMWIDDLMISTSRPQASQKLPLPPSSIVIQ